MKRIFLSLLLGVSLFAGGCSRSVPPANDTSVIPDSPIETKAQINAEIDKRFPSTAPKPTLQQMVGVGFEILESAKSERTALAVKEWATENSSLITSFQTNDSARNQAMINCNKWIVAAADAKGAQLIGQAVNTDYATAKKNALAEATRAESLPVQ